MGRLGSARHDAKEARIGQIKFSDEGVDELHGTVNADMCVGYFCLVMTTCVELGVGTCSVR